jgi:hypothetical protein
MLPLALNVFQALHKLFHWLDGWLAALMLAGVSSTLWAALVDEESKSDVHTILPRNQRPGANRRDSEGTRDLDCSQVR